MLLSQYGVCGLRPELSQRCKYFSETLSYVFIPHRKKDVITFRNLVYIELVLKIYSMSHHGTIRLAFWI
jgi:hypothetical protein